MIRILGWIGRQKARAIAALVVIGIMLPPLGAVLKPYITEAVFGLLLVAFFRTDYSQLTKHLKTPGLLITATIWTTVVIPVFIILGCTLTGVKTYNPDLFLGLVLYAIASPMMSAPAIAGIMSLDATLILAILVSSSILVPVSAPLIAHFFGLAFSLPPLDFGFKLLSILAGAALFGLGFKKLLGESVITRYSDPIDGINILLLFVFISAVMGDLGRQIVDQPMIVIGLTVFAFLMFFVLLAITYLVFRFAGAEQALALGILTSQRNMGLMVAGAGGVIPELTWLFFAVSQFPFLLSPLILSPVVRYLKQKNKTS